MTLSVKPPNKQQDSVMAPNELASVKPPNTQIQSGLSPAAQVVPVKPPNNA
jgi:hypothetical protein